MKYLKSLLLTSICVSFSFSVLAHERDSSAQVFQYSSCRVEKMNVMGPVLVLKGFYFTTRPDGQPELNSKILADVRPNLRYKRPFVGPFGPFGGGFSSDSLTEEHERQIHQAKDMYIAEGYCPQEN